MEITEVEIIQKYGKKCGRCNRNSLLQYEYDWTCFSSGFNVIKRKHKFFKIQRKRIDFTNRLKYAEVKLCSICVGVYKNYGGSAYDKIYEVLSSLKNKKLKINNILIDKYKDVFKILFLNTTNIQ